MVLCFFFAAKLKSGLLSSFSSKTASDAEELSLNGISGSELHSSSDGREKSVFGNKDGFLPTHHRSKSMK